MTAFSCPNCKNSTCDAVLIKNGYDIVRCAHCDTQQIAPLPSAEALYAHYQDPAYFNGEEAQGYVSYADMHKAFLPHFRRRLCELAKHLPACGKLLDFGCADGFFLSIARTQGWDIAGVELSRPMAQRAERELGVTVPQSIEALGEVEFGAITLWEVIEHVPQPVSTLRDLFSRLRPGGVLMLSTPNTSHWQALREPSQWEGYRPPSHLFFFTERTLRQALQQAGFDRVEIQRVAPLPPLPGWLQRASAPLQRSLGTGQAKFWPVARLAWQAIRVIGWGWQRLERSQDDIFMTLEALAFRKLV